MMHKAPSEMAPTEPKDPLKWDPPTPKLEQAKSSNAVKRAQYGAGNRNVGKKPQVSSSSNNYIHNAAAKPKASGAKASAAGEGGKRNYDKPWQVPKKEPAAKES